MTGLLQHTATVQMAGRSRELIKYRANEKGFMFGKKRLFARMEQYVQVIQIAMAEAALLDGPSKNRHCSGSSVCLLATPRPDHTSEEMRVAKDSAASILKKTQI
ncbi:MAG: hypothetical protein DMG57_30420 [Acidobacteria bacterium]|nr:MAG: hypothetical protein DMG57_30420 [Acidobacteriota bacterium]